MVVTILPGYLLTLPFINSAALLLRSVLSLLSWNLATFLLSIILSKLLTFGYAVFPVLSIAFLSRNLLTVLLGNLSTILLGHLVADLSWLVEAFLLGDH